VCVYLPVQVITLLCARKFYREATSRICSEVVKELVNQK